MSIFNNFIALAGACFFGLFPYRPLEAIDRIVQWTGGGDGLYGVANNWDLMVIPCNAGAVLFFVTIPAGTGTVRYKEPLAGCTISKLVLGNERTLEVSSGETPPGTSLTVLGPAEIAGIINISNS